MLSEILAAIKLAEETAERTDEVVKGRKSQKSKKAEMESAAFEAANVNLLRQDYLVMVGAIADAAECADATTIERLKMKGAVLAAAVGLLPKSFKDQLISAATSKPTAPTESEQQVADGAAAADKAEVSQKADATIEVGVPQKSEATIEAQVPNAPLKTDTQAEFAKSACDLVVISPTVLSQADADAMREAGFSYTRSKKPTSYIWQGHAAPETVEAIAVRNRATINKVNLPQADETVVSADPQDVSELHEIVAPNATPMESLVSKELTKAGGMPGAGADEELNLEQGLATDDNGDISDLVVMAASHGMQSNAAGDMST